MPSRTSVFTVFALAYFLSYFFRSANAVIAPDLVVEMGLSASELGLMTSLFFAAFAAVQIPLGLGLDRFGPRFVTPGLMMAGVAGSLIFAAGQGFLTLALGRALIGIGMAGILMGALKAFSQWFAPSRYPTMAGLLVGLGSAGALAAATPLAWFNALAGWRIVFVFGSVAILLVAGAIMVGTRNTPPGVTWPTGVADLRSLRTVFSDVRFWRIALLVFFTNGTLLAFQGLWAGPYLNDVYQVNSLIRGNVLLLLSLGATIGFLSSGWIAERIGLPQTVVVGTTFLIVAQVVLAVNPALPIVAVACFVFGIAGGFTIMLLAQPRLVFPLANTGQATTAINIFAIGGTFIIQWVMGIVVDRFPSDELGRYPPAAYTSALLFTAIGTLAVLVLYLPLLRGSKQAPVIP